MKKVSKILLVIIICGLFVVGITIPVKAQMTGTPMQSHMKIQAGVQQVTDGAELLRICMKMLDEGSDIAIVKPILVQANKMIQEGKETIIKARTQAKIDNGGKILQMKKMQEMKKSDTGEAKESMKPRRLRMHDHKMMKDEPVKEQPKPEAVPTKKE